MADDQDFSKPKYTISKNENGRDVIHIDNVSSKEETEDIDDNFMDFNFQVHVDPQLLKKLIFCFCVVLVIIMVLVHKLHKFDDYDVKNQYERKDAVDTSYTEYQNNLLRYSHDGAFYTEYDGDLIWNYTYEMTNPTLDICNDYILIYDKKGTQLAILTSGGFKQMVKASLPIVDANISSQGIIAILMQDGETGYIQLCDSEGTVLASGELHMKNNGYPMAIDISESGENLVISQLDINNNEIKTTISFYDFSKSGQKKIDNIVATYSFSNQIFPEITYLKNGKVVAFGDSEIVIFENNAKASISKEIFVEGQIRSVFFDREYFGTVCNTSDKDGNFICQMTVYNAAGNKKCQKSVEENYSSIQMLRNHEICFTNYKDVSLYTLQGIKKFSHSFDTEIFYMIPGDGSRRYYFINDGSTQDVRMK